MAWLQVNAAYRRRFGVPVPDWVCVFEMTKKLRLARAACKLGMPLAATVLVRDEANDMHSRWG